MHSRRFVTDIALKTMHNVTFLALVLLFGLAIGSFQNVLIARIPKQESINGRSRCDACGSQISAWQNIPIVSYLKLRGKCSNCAGNIDKSVLTVEIVTPLLFGIGFWIASNNFQFIIWFLIVLFGVPLAAIDLKVHRLPNALSYLFTASILTSLLIHSLHENNLTNLKSALIQGFALAFFYLFVRVISRGGMGMGDVKLSLPVGLISGYFGKYMIFIASYASFIIGAIFAITLLLLKKENRKYVIPFGPFMIAGLAISYLYII